MVRSRRRGFSPLSTGKLRLWLHGGARTWQDAAMTVPAALDGDVVGGWGERSGFLNNVTQATTAAKPVLRVGALNGKNVLEFDGTDDHLIRTNTASLEATDMTVMAVANVVDRVTSLALVSRWAGGFPRWRLQLRESTHPASQVVQMLYANANAARTAPALNTWHVFTGEYKSDVGEVQVRLDDSTAVVTAVAAGAVNQRALYVGATWDGAGNPYYYHKGYIAEICYFVPSLTDAERLQMLDYFTAGWGL